MEHTELNGDSSSALGKDSGKDTFSKDSQPKKGTRGSSRLRGRLGIIPGASHLSTVAYFMM